MYQSQFIEQIFSFTKWETAGGRFGKIQKKYYPELNLVKQYNAEDIIDTLRFSERRNLFKQSMDELQEDKLFVSSVHGEAHILRVCILCFFLAEKLEIDDEEFKDVLETAKYHDIGRINEEADKRHGLRGAELMNRMNMSVSQEKLKIYQAVVAAHSLETEAFEDEWKRWGNTVQEIDRGRNMLEILKDADALDRFRLRDQSLRLSFLNKAISHQMVQGAYELFHFFPGRR